MHESLFLSNQFPDGFYDKASRQYSYSSSQTLVPFLDPLVILATLAFLAFILQSFHALYLSHQTINSASHNPSLLGGVVDSLVPTKHRTLQSQHQNFNDILTGIQLYKSVIGKRRRKKRPSHVSHKSLVEQDQQAKSTPLIPINARFLYHE